MARIIKLNEAKDLGLPGRVSRQILPTSDSAAPLTLRYVEIPVPEKDASPREPHLHSDCEECIHVLGGTGEFWTEAGSQPIGPGDTVLVPIGEAHVTHNTGSDTLRLLCYFPAAALGNHG